MIVGSAASLLSCSLCDYQTIVKAQMRNHMKTKHLHVRDLPCPDCDKKFATPSSLYCHRTRTHGPKNLNCRFCSFLTNNPYQLKEHERVRHTHVGHKPYKCGYCDFLCASSRYARQHIQHRHRGMDQGHYIMLEAQAPPTQPQRGVVCQLDGQVVPAPVVNVVPEAGSYHLYKMDSSSSQQ